VSDVKRLLPTLDVRLAGDEGKGEPVLVDDAIVFNGEGAARCEPFALLRVEHDRRGRGVVSGFCKTEGLPYDLGVKAVLVVLKHHLRDEIKVSSDQRERGWAEARAAVQAALGYGEDFELDGEEHWA
jgi:hypothetical protein